MILLILVAEFFRIGLFSVGGGYAMIPLMQDLLLRMEWMPATDFLDILAVAEMTPGPIAVNAATFVGYRVAGLAGATSATVGVCLPGFLLMLAVARYSARFRTHAAYRMAMHLVRSVVCALLLSAALGLARAILTDAVRLPFGFSAGPDAPAIFIFTATLLLAGRRRFSPPVLIGAAAAAGILLYGPWL